MTTSGAITRLHSIPRSVPAQDFQSAPCDRQPGPPPKCRVGLPRRRRMRRDGRSPRKDLGDGLMATLPTVSARIDGAAGFAAGGGWGSAIAGASRPSRRCGSLDGRSHSPRRRLVQWARGGDRTRARRLTSRRSLSRTRWCCSFAEPSTRRVRRGPLRLARMPVWLVLKAATTSRFQRLHEWEGSVRTKGAPVTARTPVRTFASTNTNRHPNCSPESGTPQRAEAWLFERRLSLGPAPRPARTAFRPHRPPEQNPGGKTK